MRSLPPPTIDPGLAFTQCLQGVQNAGLRARLASIVPDVVAAAAEFDRLARTQQAFTIAPTHDVGSVKGDEMIAVYTLRMAKGGSRGRPIYDALIAAVPNKICPLCGQRTVSGLDHYLPKSEFTLLVVTPRNLVPACTDCNKAKLALVPSTAVDQTLHPYYDHLEDYETWLVAEISPGPPLAATFKADAPAYWPTEWRSRVSTHFDVLNLDSLFTSHAAQEWASLGSVDTRLGRRGELLLEHGG